MFTNLLAQNIRRLRLESNLTQEELALRLGVTGQAVSRWERGECCPDIALLPGLSNLFGVTADELLGMDELRSRARLHEVYSQEQALARQGKYCEAVQVLEQALKLWPNERGLMSELAQALAMAGAFDRAAALCECMLADATVSAKLRSSTMAALCYIYCMAGEPAKARALASSLPHARESREAVLQAMDDGAANADMLRLIWLGEVTMHNG